MGTTKTELVANSQELAEGLLPVPVRLRSPRTTPHRTVPPAPPEGGTTVPALALLSAVFVVGFEQIVSWKYGTTGIIGLLLLAVGIKAKNPAVSSMGAVVLALLVAGPAL